MMLVYDFSVVLSWFKNFAVLFPVVKRQYSRKMLGLRRCSGNFDILKMLRGITSV